MNMRKVYDEIRLNVGREYSQMFLVLVCVLFGLWIYYVGRSIVFSS